MITTEFVVLLPQWSDFEKRHAEEIHADSLLPHLAREVPTRLWQLDLFLSLVDESLEVLQGDDAATASSAAARLTAFNDAFYLFAWRLLDALRRFPHCGKLYRKAEGINIVRNQLLQHPESHTPLSSGGLIITDRGPVVRGDLSFDVIEGEVVSNVAGKDVGLYRNAEQLHAVLSRAFSR